MPDWGKRFKAGKSDSTLLVLFIPSHDRFEKSIDQQYWVEQALHVLGRCFSGAFAFPQGIGVWRDDEQGGKLLFDQPVIIQCYTNEKVLMRHTKELREFLVQMGEQTRQGAVGFVIDRHYCEIRFPLNDDTERSK